jgi:hypothetical protein
MCADKIFNKEMFAKRSIPIDKWTAFALKYCSKSINTQEQNMQGQEVEAQ